MNQSQELMQFYFQNVNNQQNQFFLMKEIKKALRVFSFKEIKMGLTNLIKDLFWSKYRKASSQWIFEKERFQNLINLTYGIDQIENEEKIKKIMDEFLNYYNLCILKDFQEEFIQIPFVKKHDEYANLKQASCFFLVNKNEIKKIIEDQEIKENILLFVFVTVLFKIFETPPSIQQYFKVEEIFEWIKEYSDELILLYDTWEKWNWLKFPLKELKLNNEELQKFYEEQKEIKDFEQNCKIKSLDELLHKH